jgi:glycosyltransferase involved in cell wall biosynthesis
MFKIVNVGGYAEKYAGKCLQSYLDQTFSDWEMLVVIDPVGDKTYENALPYASDKIHIKLNNTRQYALHNIVEGIKTLNPADDDIIIPMDLDDWLKHKDVLGYVYDKYTSNPNILLTYGSQELYPQTDEKSGNEGYTDEDFKQEKFRKVCWKCRSLKTFKYKLWKHVKDEDLRDIYGEYYRVTWDLAMFWPMLEMSGYNRILNIPEILYVYNKETAYNDDKIHVRNQMWTTDYLANRSSYSYKEVL